MDASMVGNMILGGAMLAGFTIVGRGQYREQIITQLKDLVEIQRQRIERQDRKIRKQKRKISDLEVRQEYLEELAIGRRNAAVVGPGHLAGPAGRRRGGPATHSSLPKNKGP